MVGRKAGHENGLDDIAGQASKGRKKRLVGLHVGTEGLAFLNEFIERLSHNIDFIVQILQFLVGLHQESLDLVYFLVLGRVIGPKP
jgi:hypothetical protein